MDLTVYPGTGLPTANANHVKNPQQNKFLPATMTDQPGMPGVGPDLVYRDPRGNPYVISFDLNYDNECRDAIYKLRSVSRSIPGKPGGYGGLINSQNNPDTDCFEYHGGVMVWSVGPDRDIDTNQPANLSPNRDNILSWQP